MMNNANSQYFINLNDKHKKQAIESIYQKLSDPTHPVSIAMVKQKNVKEVWIIEGLDEE